jgi:hypothetical protein
MSFQVVEVEATYTPDGWPILSSLVWDGDRLTVLEAGRRWKTKDGIHLLIRVPDGRVFELHTNGALWWASVVSRPPHMA